MSAIGRTDLLLPYGSTVYLRPNGIRGLDVRIRAIRDLAAVVRGRRQDLSLSQAELAARAGVSRKWVYQFEAGKPTAELHLVLRVLDALGLALELTFCEPGAATRSRPDLDAIIDEYRAR